MAATLDHISGGRLDLGVGAGWYEAEYDAFGYRFPPPGERRRYLEESVDVLKLLFAGGKVDYKGAYIDIEDAYCHPVPVQRPGPPIVIGATKPMMLDLVGRKAHTWNCPSGMVPRLTELRDQVLEAAAGRAVRTTIQVPVAVGRTREEADAALEIGRVHTAWMGDIDRVGITGTIDEAAEQIAAFADQGVDGLVAVLPGSRQRPDFIEAYGELARLVAS
jgi:alkanesulfonate monooxygenase SsuD/methylene tetrahydromethanopterin reductase-like flavin-dependent oxidoreductase (luciferase family)